MRVDTHTHNNNNKLQAICNPPVLPFRKHLALGYRLGRTEAGPQPGRRMQGRAGKLVRSWCRVALLIKSCGWNLRQARASSQHNTTQPNPTHQKFTPLISLVLRSPHPFAPAQKGDCSHACPSAPQHALSRFTLARHARAHTHTHTHTPIAQSSLPTCKPITPCHPPSPLACPCPSSRISLSRIPNRPMALYFPPPPPPPPPCPRRLLLGRRIILCTKRGMPLDH